MSLINDALKKAQQKRAEDAAAQTPPAPPVRPEPDTISQPHPDDTKRRIPAPPPPANRPQLPIPPPRPGNAPRPTNLPPIVNYSIPQIEPAEQPATPKTQHRVSSSIRYNPSGEDETAGGESRSGGQKTFWIAIACIAVIAIAVRLVVTLGRDDETASRSKAVPSTPPQAAVSLPEPSLPPPNFPPTRELPATAPETATPGSPASAPTPVAATPVQPTEPPPSVSFPAAPKTTAKPAQPVAVRPTPPSAKPAEPAPVVSVPTSAPAAAPAAQTTPAPAVLPPIYAPRAPTPVNNATRIQNFIDRLRVTSVRISDKGSKVILNDRLFNVGEMVDAGLELKLVKIEPGVITFSDPGGKKYIKLYQ